MKTTDEKENYYEIVKRCAKSEEDFPISNRDSNHASFIIETLFNKATSEVCILTGGLFDGVYGSENLGKEALKFLKEHPGSKLKIAFQEPTSKEKLQNSTLLKSLLSDDNIKDSIELYNASEILSPDINHFCVMDKKAFRYELNHISRKAIANFGDTATAEKLSSVFDRIIDTLTPIQVEN